MNQFNIIYYLREFYTTHVNYLREQHIKIYIRVKKKPPDFSGDFLGTLFRVSIDIALYAISYISKEFELDYHSLPFVISSFSCEGGNKWRLQPPPVY